MRCGNAREDSSEMFAAVLAAGETADKKEFAGWNTNCLANFDELKK